MSIISTHCELDTLANGLFIQTIHMKPISFLMNGYFTRSLHDWEPGDINYPHVIPHSNMLIYAAQDGMRRICPTREPDRYVEIGPPYVKPSTTWQKVPLGSATRTANAITWPATNGNSWITLIHAGHYLKLEIRLKAGYQIPGNLLAFPIGMTGLTRNGLALFSDGVPVMSISRPMAYDSDDRVRTSTAIPHSFVTVDGQVYVVFDLSGINMSAWSVPVIDPTVVLQPAAADGQDNLIVGYAGYTAYNWGITNVMQVGGTAGWAPLHSLLRMSLATIPLSSVCVSAYLQLTGSNDASQVADVPIFGYSILAANSGWAEGVTNGGAAAAGDSCWAKKVYNTTDWAGSAGCSTAGTDYNTTPIGLWAIADGSINAYSALLVPSMVEPWFGSDNNNHGILLRTTGEATNFCSLCTSDHATESYRPKITVEYKAPQYLKYRGRNRMDLSPVSSLV